MVASPQVSPPEAEEQPAPPRRLRPERRTRTDVVVGVVLAVLVLVGAIVLGATSDAANTTSVPATTPVAPPPAAGAVPAAFTVAWQAASGATQVPVVAGNVVVTGDGSQVDGRDPLTGAVSWSYRREEPLCTVGAGFGALGDGSARALALYAGHTGWCSELTALRPDTGTRAAGRNPDLRPGTQLLSNNTVVAGTGAQTIEVMRFDLVRTTEYGLDETPVQAGAQPRPQCTHATTVLGADRLGVIERCPGEQADRLTVIKLDETDDKPVVVFSELLPGSGATLVAISAEREAVALPDPARLVVLDAQGAQVGSFPIDASADELSAAASAAGGVPAASADQRQVSWWTGSSTILLDPVQLVPVGTVPLALGPAVSYGDSTLIPVSTGLAVVDQAKGTVSRTIPVARADPLAPVRLATEGEVLLEQRRSNVTALVPAS